jgi:hypothetical protein
VSTNWREILADYIAQINEKAHDRITEEGFDVGPAGSLAREQAERDVEKLADIHTNFIKFADSRPNACEHMKENLVNVRQSLSRHIHDDIIDVRDAIVGWYDPVADAFREYLGEYETALEWHRGYVDAMSAIADLQREIVDRTRDDVRSIADTLIEALEQPVDDGSSFSLGDALKVAGAVAAVAVLVATPLPDEAVAITLMSRVLGAATASVAAGSAVRPSEIQGERTIDILESAYRALDKVVDAVEQQEDAVVDALRKLQYDFLENVDTFVPQRQQADINLMEPDELRAVDPEGLRKAARDHLPTVARDNRAAALHLASIEEHEQFAFEGELHDGPLVRWQARRTGLQQIFGDIATELEDMAATLEYIASTYEDNEAAQVEGFSRISARLETS